MGLRTDEHNNPTAFTTEVAALAHLVEGTDYVQGKEFLAQGRQYWTAKLLGDPLEITLKVISRVGFRTKSGFGRWTHTNLPLWLWQRLSRAEKVALIGDMYQHEGGVMMKGLFPPLLPQPPAAAGKPLEAA
jgi:hypothetical protein